MSPHSLCLVLAALCLPVAACRSPKPRDRHAEERELSMETFKQLISEGTLQPVDSMGDPFLRYEAGMADDVSPLAEYPFADPARVDLEGGKPEPEPEPTPYVEPPQNPYVEFGDRIVVYDDGTIAKMYPLRSGTGVKMQDLLESYAPFPVWVNRADGPDPPEDPRSYVSIDLREGWDIELVSDLRKPVPDAGAPLPLADWLVAVATPQLLAEVEDFINTFAAGVPQIEIEAKIVEVTITETLSTGVSQLDPATPIADFPDNTLLKDFGFNFPIGAGGAATLGAIQDGVAFNAVLEALATYENVSIISRPKVAVREGGRAQIVNTTEIPFFNITGISSATSQFGASLTFKQVGVQLYVVPRVVGTEAVALNIDIEVSQQSGTAVTFVTADNEQISNPILSKRAASTIVYLEPGQAVILGGLITERTVDTEDKIPILGDIPILEYLFGRTVKTKEQTNVLFFIRPRILQGADVNREF